jgi:hypothetical protein
MPIDSALITATAILMILAFAACRWVIFQSCPVRPAAVAGYQKLMAVDPGYRRTQPGKDNAVMTLRSLPKTRRRSSSALTILQVASAHRSSGSILRRPAGSLERSKISVFYRLIRRRVLRFLRSVTARIDLEQFPGSCCG